MEWNRLAVIERSGWTYPGNPANSHDRDVTGRKGLVGSRSWRWECKHKREDQIGDTENVGHTRVDTPASGWFCPTSRGVLAIAKHRHRGNRHPSAYRGGAPR